jgi:dihydroceramidase
MLASFSRETYLLVWSKASRTIPDKKKAAIVKVLRTGFFLFLFGFFVWNLDNIFCDTWTRMKQAVGWPAAFFMEGRFVKCGDDYALFTKTRLQVTRGGMYSP